jgi:hypothetical protein
MSQRQNLHVRDVRVDALERIGKAAKRAGLSRAQFITGILNDWEPVAPLHLAAQQREQAMARLREWFECDVVAVVDRRLDGDTKAFDDLPSDDTGTGDDA